MKEKRIEARIIKIINCIEKSGERRDYETEDRIRRNIEEKNYSESRYGSWGSNYTDNEEYKDALYDYVSTARGLGSHIEKDEWTGEGKLYSYQKWFEYEVLISYIVGGKEYIKQESLESSFAISIDEKCFVYYNVDNPEKISWFSNSDTTDRALKKMTLGVFIVWAVFFIVTILVLYILIK